MVNTSQLSPQTLHHLGQYSVLSGFLPFERGRAETSSKTHGRTRRQEAGSAHPPAHPTGQSSPEGPWRGLGTRVLNSLSMSES